MLNRSWSAVLVAAFLRVKKTRKNEESYYHFINDRKQEPYPETKSLGSTNNRIEKNYLGDLSYFTINKNSQAPIVLYIHGGAYVHSITKFHISMLDDIATKTGCEIILPMYKLAPWGNYKDNYASMIDLYKKVIEEESGRKIIVMGDSAGGGFSLGLCELMKEYHLRQPDELVLLSPWVDVTCSNPDIEKYASLDPMLTAEWLRGAVRNYANGDDLTQYLLSPLNGDVSCLNNVTIFVGTREIFYPDNILLKQKLEENGVNIELFVGEDMNHVYPVYPIPEAKKARNKIIQVVNR